MTPFPSVSRLFRFRVHSFCSCGARSWARCSSHGKHDVADQAADEAAISAFVESAQSTADNTADMTITPGRLNHDTTTGADLLAHRSKDSLVVCVRSFPDRPS